MSLWHKKKTGINQIKQVPQTKKHRKQKISKWKFTFHNICFHENTENTENTENFDADA